MSPIPFIIHSDQNVRCVHVPFTNQKKYIISRHLIDPHFKTFNGQHFSFHGECDLVLMKSKNFASGLGLDIQIRTTRVQNGNHNKDAFSQAYSFISGVAMKVNQDILEVETDGNLIVNGKAMTAEEKHTMHAFSGCEVSKALQGSKKAIVVYDVHLDQEHLGDTNEKESIKIQIRVNTKLGMMFIDVHGSFPDSVGLLGNKQMSQLMARDGITDLRDYWNSLGEEWQVQSNTDEPVLFQEHRAPQYPTGCSYEKKTVDKNRSSPHRRLADHGMKMDVALAEEACSKVTGYKRSFCIQDVVATGDIELAEDSFYD